LGLIKRDLFILNVSNFNKFLRNHQALRNHQQ